MDRSTARSMLAVAVLVVLAVTLGAAAPAPPRIDIKQHKYSPQTVTIAVGSTVTWVNHDEDVHTVVSTTQAFTSRAIDTDESFSYTFTKPGTYTYFCTLHPLMTATVVVK